VEHKPLRLHLVDAESMWSGWVERRCSGEAFTNGLRLSKNAVKNVRRLEDLGTPTTILCMYPYVFVAGPNKHNALLIPHVPTELEIRHAMLPMVRAADESLHTLLRTLNGEKGVIEPMFVKSSRFDKENVEFCCNNSELGVCSARLALGSRGRSHTLDLHMLDLTRRDIDGLPFILACRLAIRFVTDRHSG
jgi:hypothetical protein